MILLYGPSNPNACELCTSCIEPADLYRDREGGSEPLWGKRVISSEERNVVVGFI